jgi:sortase A
MSVVPLKSIILGFALSLTAVSWFNSAYIHAKAELAQLLISRSWQRTTNELRVKPWYWADTWPVARLVYANEDVFVLAGAHGSALAFGPGHVDGTAAPGFPGTSIVAGHRDTHFSFLREMQLGELIRVQNREGLWQDYSVDSIDIIDTSVHAGIVVDQASEELVLITCYPFDAIQTGGPLRYVVNARRRE